MSDDHRPVHPEQFTGNVPLVPGTIRGARRFRIGPHPQDRLNSPMYAYTWQDGVNHAQCPDPVNHSAGNVGVGSVNCTCGFYAFFDPDAPLDAGNVAGIVECSGRVTVGTRGFRAEKARVVALVKPGFIPSRPHPGLPLGWLTRRTNRTLNTFITLSICWSVLGFSTTVAGLLAQWPLWEICASIATFLVFAMVGAAADYAQEWQRITRTEAELQKLLFGRATRQSWDNLLAAYPSIRAYDSMDDAICDFPLSEPMIAPPAEQEDPASA